MKWNQFFGGVLVGAAFGIMVGVAVAPGSGQDKVTTSTAGFCSMLAIAGVAAARAVSPGAAQPSVAGVAGVRAEIPAGVRAVDRRA